MVINITQLHSTKSGLDKLKHCSWLVGEFENLILFPVGTKAKRLSLSNYSAKTIHQLKIQKFLISKTGIRQFGDVGES